MSVFNEIGKDIEYFKYSTDNEKVDVHMCINKELMEDLNKVVAVYKNYGFDKTNKTELFGMVLSEFIASLTDETGTILELMAKMKDFSEENNDYFIGNALPKEKTPKTVIVTNKMPDFKDETNKELIDRMELL